MFLCSAPVYAGWWNTNWSERLELTFDNSGQAETLVDVPVLVTLTPVRVDYTKMRPLGADIRFIDGTSGAELDYEIESWVDGGTSHVWVKVPTIEGYSQTDRIWLYYGNPSAFDDQDPGAVWSSGFRAVWHLRETDIDGDPGDIKDSTSFANDGTTFNMNVAVQQPGQINGSFDFDGIDDYVDVADGDSLSFTDNINDAPFSLSFWVRPNASSEDYLVSKTFETVGQEKREWAIWVRTGGLVRFTLYDNGALTDFIIKIRAFLLPPEASRHETCDIPWDSIRQS